MFASWIYFEGESGKSVDELDGEYEEKRISPELCSEELETETCHLLQMGMSRWAWCVGNYLNHRRHCCISYINW